MNKIRQVMMKSDAESIVGASLADELEKAERLKEKSKGEMVLKGEKGIEVSLEFRPYGGATSIAEAVSYVEARQAAAETLREIDQDLSVFDAVCENILADDSITDKKSALKGVLAELRGLLEEEKSKVVKSNVVQLKDINCGEALTLAGARRIIARKYPNVDFVSLGLVCRAIVKNIRNSGSRNQSLMISDLDQEIREATKRSSPPTRTKGTVSIREAAMRNSGLDPRTGKLIERSQARLGEVVQVMGLQSVVDKIEKARPGIVERAAVKKGSLKYLALLNSGINPEDGSILF